MNRPGPETALAARYYTDREIFEQEKARIFSRCWLYAGHTSQLATPGEKGALSPYEGARVEEFCGFIFVNRDPGAAPMAAWYPGVEAALRAYVPDIDNLAPYRTTPVEEQCNWKVTVENYNECYHCVANHPTFAQGVIDPKNYNVTAQGHCLRHTTVAANLERMTYPIDLSANDHATDYGSWFLWPTFSFQVYPGNVLNTYFFQPLAVDRTMAWRGWYTMGGAPCEVIDGLADQDRETTLAEDVTLVNAVQRGLNSMGYTPGPLVLDPAQGVNSEHSVAALKGWVLAALDGRGDHRGPAG